MIDRGRYFEDWKLQLPVTFNIRTENSTLMFNYRSINRTNFHNLVPDNLHMSIPISISAFALKHPLIDTDNHVQKKSKNMIKKSIKGFL